MTDLNDPARGNDIRSLLQRKFSLRQLYQEVYSRYAEVLTRCPAEGLAIELGSGVGFAGTQIRELTTTDVLPYEGVDLVFDARQMPFADQSLRFIGMLNVFHHIPDVGAFLAECQRCLMPGGRVLIVDQYPGWFARWIYRYCHHEPWHPESVDWTFPSTGPLSGANGALAWIVFQRDRQRFAEQFPRLHLAGFRPHTPLRYWLSGGLKSWCLIPPALWKSACRIDAMLLRCSPEWGSFVDIELKGLTAP
jgi:SAM-dependent methyltransferase